LDFNMAIFTPDRYPLHDTADVNSANLPTAYSLQGFPAFSIADPRATNALLQVNGGWTQYNDFTLVRASDTHNSSTAYRLSLNLGYATGAGLASLSPTTNPVYVFRGNVIRFRDSFLMDQGLDPITFTASMRTWIYCGADGTVRVDVVALATGATPAVGEFTVIGVDTDATDITAIVTTSSPAFELHFTGPNCIIDTNLAVLGDSSFVGNVDVTGVVTLGAGGLDMNGSSISNADNIGCETLVANTSVDTATLNASGLATLNSVSVGTTLGVTGVLTATGGISLPSGADAIGTAGTTFTGGTVDTIDSTGAVKVGEIQFYSDTTPSTTGNVMQSFGRGLTLGLSTVARRIAIPFDNYVASLVSTSSSTATGATIDVVLVTGDVVYVTASADLENDTIGTVIVFEIVVNGVIQNTAGNLRSDTVGVPICCNRTVKYTAASDAVYTFVQRYGAIAGNTLGVNGFISVRQGN
jgi:hypothetical protein